MKLNLTIFIILMLACSACEDQLDQAPLSNPSTANFYRNTADFEKGVNGIYNTLSPGPNVTDGSQAINGYAIRRFELSEIRSDNVYSPGTGVRDWNPINNFEKTLATNPNMNEAWYANYLGIMRANTILDNLNSTLVPDEATLNRMEGEAKFLRAFFYFDLIRWFGKVPLVDHAISIEEALVIPRSAVSDVYSLVISDLTEAIAKLPETQPAASKGRATSLAAKAFLGMVYLTRTGMTYGIEGPGLGTNEYTEAVSLFNEVISSGKFSWVTNYASIFSYTNEGNGDIVFDIQAIGGNTGDLGVGARFPSEIYDGAYGLAIGLGFAGGADVDSPKAPSIDLQSSYEAGDVRYTFSILPSYVNLSGNTVDTGQFMKFFDASKKGADRFNWSINYPALRYTDVLMMKAEAIVRGGFGGLGTQQDVDDIVNMVRERAGLEDVSNVNLDMLLLERRHEFAGEGLRWHDLVRTGKVLDVMSAWDTVDDVQNKVKPMTADEIIYPIPQTQLTTTPGLYAQNPGYN